MKKNINWKVFLAIILILISFTFYAANLLIFKEPRNVFFYFFIDLGFLPLSVLLVTLFLDSLLNQREKKTKLNKLNMVIGAFFSEVGSSLLADLKSYDKNADFLMEELKKINTWNKKEYAIFKYKIMDYKSAIDISCEDELKVKQFLVSKRDFLLRLLENPNLLEHETFTELLWAVFHMTEELSCRKSFDNQPEADLAHINGDFKRGYNLLIKEWITYIEHLKSAYPYLYSLAVRQNPFNKDADVFIS